MKRLCLLFLFISSFFFSQMPNIEKVWLNNSQPYIGTIDKAEIRLKVNVSEQNRKADQEYFIAGYSMVKGANYSKFEGKLIVEKYKDRRKGGTVYGTYELLEEPKGQHSGKFTGKFVYNFKWNRKSEKIDSQDIKFDGDWKSYDQKLSFKTTWSNQLKKH